MTNSDSQRSAAARKNSIQQGSLVTYYFPCAQKPELPGLLTGLVLPSNGFIQSGAEALYICPMVASVRRGEEDKVLVIPTRKDRILLRPDLVSAVAISGIKPVYYSSQSAETLVYPYPIVEAAINRFLDIITPTPEKMRERPDRGFMGFGQVGWLEKWPYPNSPYEADSRPAVCLTPASFRETGTALMIAGGSNIGEIDYQKSVEVHVKGQKAGRYHVSSLQSLALSRLSKDREAFWHLDERALRGIVAKMRALFFEEARERVARKYSCKPGQIPDCLKAVLPKMQHGRSCSPGHRP